MGASLPVKLVHSLDILDSVRAVGDIESSPKAAESPSEQASVFRLGAPRVTRTGRVIARKSYDLRAKVFPCVVSQYSSVELESVLDDPCVCGGGGAETGMAVTISSQCMCINQANNS